MKIKKEIQKISFSKIVDVLSRYEMRQIMAGSGGGGSCGSCGIYACESTATRGGSTCTCPSSADAAYGCH